MYEMEITLSDTLCVLYLQDSYFTEIEANTNALW